jgi:hypothetical protein
MFVFYIIITLYKFIIAIIIIYVIYEVSINKFEKEFLQIHE